MPDYNGNGWNEWSKHVLKELERLNVSYQQISTDVSALKAKVTNYNPEKITKLEIEVKNLQIADADQESRLRNIEQKTAVSGSSVSKIDSLAKDLSDLEKREAKLSGKWAILALFGAALVSALVGFIFKAFAESSPPDNTKKSSGVIEKVLSPKQLADLRKQE